MNTWRGTTRADYWQGEIGDRLEGLGGNDTLFGSNVKGGAGDDSLFDYSGNDRAFGGSGNDLMVSSEGDDILFGGRGNDTLVAGRGSDTLAGGRGDDVLEVVNYADYNSETVNSNVIWGGLGNDTFDFSSSIPFLTDAPAGVNPRIGIGIVRDFKREDIILLKKPDNTPFGSASYRFGQSGGNTNIYATIYNEETALIGTIEDVTVAEVEAAVQFI